MIILEIPVFSMIAIGALAFVAFLAVMLSAFLKKAAPGTAIVKTGFGLTQAAISTSSAIVIPLLHKAETIDMTVKTIRIRRRDKDSLSCADGIRAEVEVDFYIKINPVDEDIRRVANSVGCTRASSLETIRELFEAKFSDALKTAGSKLSFDQLYQNRRAFKDEILIALGQEGESDIVLNGYRMDDVAIQYLEQLPLDQHDQNNVLDAKGIKEIAQRTSSEAESANQRLNEKNVTIATQNQMAETKQLEINQDLAQKRAKQRREIQEVEAKEAAIAEKTRQEQETVAEQANIARELSLRIAEQKKQEEIMIAEKVKEKAIQVAEEDKAKAIELAKIQRESAIADQTREKLVMLEKTALQEAQKIKAEEQAVTVKAVEVAQRDKQIEVIASEKEAQVQLTTQKVEADSKAYNILKESQTKLDAAELDLQAADKRAKTEIIEAEKEAKKELTAQNVSADMEAYRLRTVAQAKLEAAELEYKAAEKQAESIRQIGQAQAEALLAKIQAENTISTNKILSEASQALIPLLPQIIEKLMLPAEKIDSIKFLHISGMEGLNGQNNQNNNLPTSPVNSIVNTLMSVGLAMPLLKEVMNSLKSKEELSDIFKVIKDVPGAEKLLKYVEEYGDKKPEKVLKADEVE
jgi:uncharacterized membrane protein YqiK